MYGYRVGTPATSAVPRLEFFKPHATEILHVSTVLRKTSPNTLETLSDYRRLFPLGSFLPFLACAWPMDNVCMMLEESGRSQSLLKCHIMSHQAEGSRLCRGALQPKAPKGPAGPRKAMAVMARPVSRRGRSLDEPRPSRGKGKMRSSSFSVIGVAATIWPARKPFFSCQHFFHGTLSCFASQVRQALIC